MSNPFRLQQYLPLAVLKPQTADAVMKEADGLQQYLPLAVLKQSDASGPSPFNNIRTVATVLTACGIETHHIYYILL